MDNDKPFARSRLRDWASQNVPEENKLWRDAALDQVRFFDRLTSLIASGLPYEQHDNIAEVIGTHRSKSITLPVVQWTRPDLGLTLTARDNFYNFKLSVSCDRPIDVPQFAALFHTTPPPDPAYTGDPLHPVYFEGFPSVLVYGYQASNNRVWSAEINGSHAMWTAVFLCMRSLGAIGDQTWASRRPEATTT